MLKALSERTHASSWWFETACAKRQNRRASQQIRAYAHEHMHLHASNCALGARIARFCRRATSGGFHHRFIEGFHHHFIEGFWIRFIENFIYNASWVSPPSHQGLRHHRMTGFATITSRVSSPLHHGLRHRRITGFVTVASRVSSPSRRRLAVQEADPHRHFWRWQQLGARARGMRRDATLGVEHRLAGNCFRRTPFHSLP
eukprot:5525198-Pleurochrysis_carterae.AAC.1